MILADLKLKSDAETDIAFDKETKPYPNDQSQHTVEETGNIPHWIDEQKKATIPQQDNTPVPIINV